MIRKPKPTALLARNTTKLHDRRLPMKSDCQCLSLDTLLDIYENAVWLASRIHGLQCGHGMHLHELPPHEQRPAIISMDSSPRLFWEMMSCALKHQHPILILMSRMRMLFSREGQKHTPRSRCRDGPLDVQSWLKRVLNSSQTMMDSCKW